MLKGLVPKLTPGRVLLLLVWAALLVIGVWGVWMRLATGHLLANYGSYVPWGLWVAAYIYFAGLSAGAFLVAGLRYVFKVEALRPVGRLSLITAFVCLVLGLVIVAFDLGHMWRSIYVFLRPTFSSMMAWMVWLYAAYAVVLVVALYFSLKRNEAKARLWVGLGLPLIIFFPGGAGALFGTVVAQYLWHSPIYPILFLAGGLLSGVALMTAIAGLALPQERATVTFLGRATLVLILLYALLEWAEFSIPLWYGVGHEYEALMGVLFGPFWYVFWIVHVLFGMLIPALLLWRLPQRPRVVGLAGLLTAGAFLAVRLNLVIPSQVQPQLKGLINAYQDARLRFEYVPSFFEWSVVAFAVAVGALLIYLGDRLFIRREVA